MAGDFVPLSHSVLCSRSLIIYKLIKLFYGRTVEVFSFATGMKLPNGMKFIVRSEKVVSGRCVAWVHPT